MDQLIYKGFIGAIIVFLFLFVILNLLIRKFFKTSKKRPSEITTLCVIFGIGLIVTLTRLLNNKETFTNTDLLITTANFASGILWLIGIWQMKKWGAIGYILTAIATQLLLVIQGTWSIFGLLLLFPIVILLYFFPKMR